MQKQRAGRAGKMSSVMLGLTLGIGCASPHRDTMQAEDSMAVAQITRGLQEVISAAENKDFERLDSYHLYGPKFTKFTTSLPERLDATAGRKGEHDGLGAARGLKMRADGLKIDVFGNVGIATFILDYSFEAGGQVAHRKERSTIVFVKEGDGSWKIAHEHLSRISE